MVEFVVSGRIFEGRTIPRHAPSAAAAQRHRLERRRRADHSRPTSTRSSSCAPKSAAATAWHDVKLVLITNASMFHRPRVRRALETLPPTAAKSGRNSTPAPKTTTGSSTARPFPWRQILDNLRAAAAVRPIVIQTLFMRIRGEAAAARRIGSLLRPASGDRGRGRADQAGAKFTQSPESRPRSG